MTQAVQTVEADLRSTPGVEIVLATAGGGFIGGVNQGGAYVRIVPIEERSFSISRLWRGLIHGRLLEAFQNNYSQREVMQEIRTRLRKYKDLRCSVRNAPSFNIGSGG